MACDELLPELHNADDAEELFSDLMNDDEEEGDK